MKKNKVLVDKFRKSFKEHSEDIFVFDSMKDKEYTYSAFEELSQKLAIYLKNKGILKGDRVCVILSNQIEVLLIYFACMQLGAISVPINTSLKSKEIKYIISDSKPKIIFGNKSTLNSLGMSNEIKKMFMDEIDLFNQICDLTSSSKDLFDSVEDTSTMFIVYTSGTTKTPKGVVLSYKSIIGNALSFSKTAGITNKHRFYEILPLSYLAGLFNTVLIPFCVGGSVVLDETFNLKTMLNFWNKVIKYEVNAFWLNPSIVSILVNFDRKKEGIEYCKQGHVDVIFVGTSHLPNVLEKSFKDKYGIQLNESYGLSEILIVSSNSPNFEKNKGAGKIIIGQNVRILNDDGTICKVGFDGEIVVNSDFMMDCYLNKKEETKEVIREGLFFTGDVGHIDKDGYLFITGRKKDLIIRGGRNISPKEIEEVILSSGLVREVAVVGIPDDIGGEKIVAAVVYNNKKLNPEDIIIYCKNNLAEFKIPNKIVQINNLPKSVNGKVQKNLLRKILKD